MSDTTKPMVVWATRQTMEHLRRDTGKRKEFTSWMPLTGVVNTRNRNGDDVPHLLLPIENRALRVGEYLFRWGRNAEPEWRHVEDPDDEWCADGPDMLRDLLMDAVEGVEP